MGDRDRLNPDFVRFLMRNPAVGRKTKAAPMNQKPQGRSGPAMRFIPGTAAYEALLTERFKNRGEA